MDKSIYGQREVTQVKETKAERSFYVTIANALTCEMSLIALVIVHMKSSHIKKCQFIDNRKKI